MKCKYFFVIPLFLMLIANYAIAQATLSADTSLKNFNIIPAIKIVRLDSSIVKLKSIFLKQKPTVVLFFSPDCDHCQQEIEGITKQIDRIKDIQFILVSNRPLYLIKPFAKQLQLSKYPNIKVYSNIENTLFRFYGIGAFPSMVIYNKNGVATKKYVSSMVSINDIINWSQAE